MRVKTRSGRFITIKDDSVLEQEKRIGQNETYYVIRTADGGVLHLSQPIIGVPYSKVIDYTKKGSKL